MSDMNKVILQGVVPAQDWAIHAINMDDEAHACVHVKVSVRNGQKNDSGYENEDMFDAVALGKTAINFMKFQPLGRAFIFEGRLTPSRPRLQNGQPVLDANGKKEYFPMGFQFYAFDTQRGDHGSKNGASNNAPQRSSQPAQKVAEFNPLADDSFDFGNNSKNEASGGIEDFNFAL